MQKLPAWSSTYYNYCFSLGLSLKSSENLSSRKCSAILKDCVLRVSLADTLQVLFDRIFFLLKMKGVLIDPLKPKYSQIFHFRSKGYGCWIWCSWNWYPLNGSWIDVDLINALIFVNLCCYQNVEYGVDVEHEFYQLVVVLSIGVADLTLVHRGTSTAAADCSVGGYESKTGGWEWGGRLGSTQPSLLHRSTSLVLVSGAARVAWPACHLTGKEKACSVHDDGILKQLRPSKDSWNPACRCNVGPPEYPCFFSSASTLWAAGFDVPPETSLLAEPVVITDVLYPSRGASSAEDKRRQEPLHGHGSSASLLRPGTYTTPLFGSQGQLLLAGWRNVCLLDREMFACLLDRALIACTVCAVAERNAGVEIL